jgi:pilus assembly protein Flp/PilA
LAIVNGNEGSSRVSFNRAYQKGCEGAASGKEPHLEQLRRPLQIRSQPMNKLFARFAKDESGATAIEYGLIASLISVAIIGALTTIGTKLTGTFGNVSANLK